MKPTLPKETLTKLAKKYKKEHGCSHMQALEAIVKQLGYHNWNHYCNHLKEKK